MCQKMHTADFLSLYLQKQESTDAGYKETDADYWSRRAEGFSSLRLRELQGKSMTCGLPS